MLDALLQGIVEEPLAEDRWLVLADWLEEHDDPRRAELLRLYRRMLATCCTPDQNPQREAWQARMVALLAEGVEPCVPRRTLLLGNRRKVPMTFRFIPPGSFLMGSPESEPNRAPYETLHRVTLTKGYWLGTHPVTQAQWRAIMGRKPSRFKGVDLPVETVSWDDCQEFVKRLGEQAGQRFRLPTEAEWERACRAGTTTPFHFGETISTEQANYDGDESYGQGIEGVDLQTTTPVGIFPANAWGLFDMHGNVEEWCQDWFGTGLSGDVKDPQGVDEGDTRIVRGGCWGLGPSSCRAASRGGTAPDYPHPFTGCRVVLCLD